MIHSFTSNIKAVLLDLFGEDAESIFLNSYLIQYINQKTKSVNKGSKSRASFANIYALYVIIEDYIDKGFVETGGYSKYSGAQFVNLLRRQRELPFGSKLQNHALNNRMNSEFQGLFPTLEVTPILRDLKTNRYWINENLIIVDVNNKRFNIANAVIRIIDEYISVKQDSFRRFITCCETLQNIEKEKSSEIHNFIFGLLEPNVDARLFEIVSYSILKYYYMDKNIIWGYDMDNLNTEKLKLYKTGRTNANDGGIDFVMKPLGRFFQVTETLDFKKYFLDIDKIEKYPISFVIKSEESVEELQNKLRNDALRLYVIEHIVDKYMKCIEELINIPVLKACFEDVKAKGVLDNVLEEIILQSKVEFNEGEDDEN